MLFFFVKQKTAYEMRISDWSSDVCSSDLLQSSEPDHPPCNVHDLDRLTHVEHEDAAMIHAAPQGTGAALQDKLHCFLHRHEIALDVLMRDGERTVAAELPLEEGNERAARPQHIAEPHRHETSAAVPSRAVKIERL